MLSRPDIIKTISRRHAASSMHPKYRKDIDGLRAIAVILVVLYHAFPQMIPGGFIGVDVFFVISGFLISTIIIENISAGTFSFGTFYARRIKRIFPALFIVLIACAAIGWFVLLPNDYKQLGVHLMGGATFISNLLLWHESGYFDVSSELKPLLHLWSLGVEEQFYLLWPLALWLCCRARFSTRTLTWILAFLSIALSAAIVRASPVADFYSPATRFWELMLGCALAHASLSEKRFFPGIDEATGHALDRNAPPIPAARGRFSLADGKSLLGICCLGVSAFYVNKSAPFPGILALFPTVGAYFLISAGPEALLNRNFLSNPVLVFIGLISYPIYLWHWPLLSFARIYQSQTPAVATRAALVVLSVVLAWITYEAVEKRLRFGRLRARIVVGLSSAMVMVGLAGLAIVVSHGFPSRLNVDAQRYANFKYDSGAGARVNTCWLTDTQAPDAYADNCVDKDSARHRPLLLIWGDSQAARLFPGLSDVFGGQFRLAQYTRSACPPFFSSLYMYEICSKANLFVLQKVAELKPEVVVLFSYWALHAVPDSSAVTTSLNVTIGKLRALGIARIIVIGPAPRWITPLPDNLVHIQLAHALSRAPERTLHGLDLSIEKLDTDLQHEFEGKSDVFYFSAFNALCDRRGCLTRVGDDLDALTSWDYGHLTSTGAAYVARQLLDVSNDLWLHSDDR